MKALLEHNGFTRMEEVANPPQILSIPVSPPMSALAPINIDTSMKTIDVWEFELYDLTFIDGESVAIYKYAGRK